MRHPTRRALLAGAASALGLLGLSPRSLGAAAGGRSFLFVFVQGGWDPTKVFAPAFDHPLVDIEPDCAPASSGDLRWVAHGARPSVDAFFARHGARTLLVNGLVVPSIQHEVCTRLVLTGSAAVGQPDWGTRLGDALGADATLPHLVCGGPSFPGPFPAAVARTGANGQLDALLTGDVLGRSVVPVAPPSPPAEAVVDRYLVRRAEGRRLASLGTPAEHAVDAYRRAVDHALALKDLRYDTDLSGGGALLQQAGVAVDALSRGISRCVSVVDAGGGGFGWDTHADNDAQQSALFEALFADLGRLMDLLVRTPGRAAPTLADETVVVVLSEMGRTPRLNGALGKDHWPTTSAMLVGPGLTGGRVVGGFDQGWSGEPVDPVSARIDDRGVRLGPKTLGATLLRLAGLDPAETLPGVPALEDVVA